MATRIGVMSEGKILQVGKPAEIYETPNCRFVADFIGSVNSFRGTIEVDEPDHVVVASPECRHFISHGITKVGSEEKAKPPAEPPADVKLLTEIRDLLATRK